MKLKEKFNKNKIWFTSDTHYGHTNIIDFCDRLNYNKTKFKTKRRMKRQFKLIKWYPSLPTNWKVGHIVTSVGRCYLDYVSCDECKPGAVEKEEVEYNSEFWEEIISSKYEVLSIKHKAYSNKILKVKNYIVGKGATLESSSRTNDFNTVRDSYEYIFHNYNVHSIKRTSDGEVFTVGDKICNTVSLQEKRIGYVTICSFEIDINYLKINIDTGFIADYHSLFDDFTHYKKSVLFTTEDGIDMFEGDTYYALNPKTYEAVWSIADECSLDSDWLKFSNKAKAERWVLENMPKYSLSQVKKALKDSSIYGVEVAGAEYIHTTRFFRKLME